MNHDERGERSLGRWRVEDSLHGFVAALVGDSLAVGSECGKGEENSENQQVAFFMGVALAQITIAIPGTALQDSDWDDRARFP